MDAAYPAIIDEDWPGILAVRGNGTVSRHRPRDERCAVLTSYTLAWKCLFPQHGAGAKHQRPIVLEEWQRSVVREHPGWFAQG
jgi:hypothetical protein